MFIDIRRPDHDEPLLLMCGSDFEILRTDKTGLEIYGKAHNGREYLLFPISFKALDAGVLEVRVPTEYREWFMERCMDGARIEFGTPHGRPFFPDMPEEYCSSSGYLRIDGEGMTRVELDRLEPGDFPPEHDDFEPGGCSCGHSHKEETPPAASCGCEGISGHGHGLDVELAGAIRAAAEELNALLRAASAAGVSARLTLDGAPDESGVPVTQRVRVSAIFRQL